MLKSPGLMVSASGISNTFLPSDPNFDLVIQGIVAIDDKLLENKCISKKQHKQLLIKCNLLHK